MSEFVASNGYRIDVGAVYNRAGSIRHYLGKYTLEALREFFQHERDEELGRWRWPLNPDYVVYTQGDGWIVTSERSANSKHYSHREHAQVGTSILTQAMRAYFEAHPEPKPEIPSEPRTAWVDKYGTDVWHVGVDGVIRCVLSSSSDPAKYAPFTRLVPERQS